LPNLVCHSNIGHTFAPNTIINTKWVSLERRTNQDQNREDEKWVLMSKNFAGRTNQR
jgi:hypothetical protein